MQERYEEERLEREKTMMDVRETQNRLGRATTYGRGDEDKDELVGGGTRSRFKSAEQLNVRKEQRKRFQFEATASDDELEDELDDNLDEIGEATKRLKALGMAMGQELDNQNARIEVIEGKAVRTEQKIHMNTERVRQIYLSIAKITYTSPPCSSRESSSIMDKLSDKLCNTQLVIAVTDKSCAGLTLHHLSLQLRCY